MRNDKAQWPTSGLLRELSAIEQVFADGNRAVRLSALCWMAAVVASLPPGSGQDAAEDRLSALIAEAALEPQALCDVLAFRRQGMLATPWPTTPTLRRGRAA